MANKNEHRAAGEGEQAGEHKRGNTPLRGYPPLFALVDPLVRVIG